jgi:hypothetical protein
MSDPTTVPDPADDQAIAEELDPDALDDADDDYPSDYPPDRALASQEARLPIDTGDVPQDSLEERLWREEPDVANPVGDAAVEIVDPHPDAGLDPDFAADARTEQAHEPDDDGLTADAYTSSSADDPGTPAEEAAIHVIDEDGTS